MTNMLVARTSHLDNRMHQMMSFCSDISQQGDKFRSRLDGLTKRLDTSAQRGDITLGSLSEICFGSKHFSPRVDSAPRSERHPSRTFTPQVIRCHTGDLMADAEMDVPTEGCTIFDGG